jgi:hypothetical protein
VRVYQSQFYHGDHDTNGRCVSPTGCCGRGQWRYIFFSFRYFLRFVFDTIGSVPLTLHCIICAYCVFARFFLVFEAFGCDPACIRCCGCVLLVIKCMLETRYVRECVDVMGNFDSGGSNSIGASNTATRLSTTGTSAAICEPAIVHTHAPPLNSFKHHEMV